MRIPNICIHNTNFKTKQQKRKVLPGGWHLKKKLILSDLSGQVVDSTGLWT